MSKLRAAAQLLIRAYQVTLSPFVGTQCRFYPTCSHYSKDAIHRFGFFKGGLCAIWRICRCNPWSRGGFDPVPDTFPIFKRDQPPTKKPAKKPAPDV